MATPSRSKNSGLTLALPCDFPSAQLAKFKVTTVTPEVIGAGVGKMGAGVTNVFIATAELEPSEVQDLGAPQ